MEYSYLGLESLNVVVIVIEDEEVDNAGRHDATDAVRAVDKERRSRRERGSSNSAGLR